MFEFISIPCSASSGPPARMGLQMQPASLLGRQLGLGVRCQEHWLVLFVPLFLHGTNGWAVISHCPERPRHPTSTSYSSCPSWLAQQWLFRWRVIEMAEGPGSSKVKSLAQIKGREKCQVSREKYQGVLMSQETLVR